MAAHLKDEKNAMGGAGGGAAGADEPGGWDGRGAAGLAPARAVALAILMQVRQRKAFARDLLRTSLEFNGLSERDRALATRLIMGTVAASGALKAQVLAYVKTPKKIQPQVLDALMLSAFELLYLKTPVQVAVSQGVSLVRSVVPRAAGLANAVLRKVAAERADVQAAHAHVKAFAAGTYSGSHADLASDLERAAALPAWLANELLGSMTPRDAACFGLAELEAPPVWVAVNQAAEDAQALPQALVDSGFEPKPTSLEDVFCLAQPASLSQSPLVKRGALIVSDLSAQCVAALVTPERGTSLLEIGQGRGTKTMLMASNLVARQGYATLVASDVSASKVKAAKRRVEPFWPGSYQGLALDGCLLAKPCALDEAGEFQTFDQVFIDAPCSGTGTLRRHPEIVWSLEPKALAATEPNSLVAIQRALLQAAATRVRPGGVLFYATCSVLRQENEDAIAAFLASSEGQAFVVVNATDHAQSLNLANSTCEFIRQHTTPEGYFKTKIHEGSPDGHFLACLRRLVPQAH